MGYHRRSQEELIEGKKEHQADGLVFFRFRMLALDFCPDRDVKQRKLFLL
jgi:hypothetical protein